MVDIYKLKLTILQQEILNFLFIYAGSSFNARNLAKKLNVSSTAILKALPKLKKEDLIIIDKDKESGRLSIELNRDNKKVIYSKRVQNLKMIYDSGLVDFLIDLFPGNTIILFGSYSRGEDICFNKNQELKSDIDIAIIGMKERQIDLSKFEIILERKIIINYYFSFKRIHKNLRDNILNGILLAGSVET